jgi:RimJ/RimL family protein N-acetyltransferase
LATHRTTRQNNEPSARATHAERHVARGQAPPWTEQTVDVQLEPCAIVASRLTLSPLVTEDSDAMVEVLADERMHEFTGGRPLALNELRTRYQRLAVGHSADGTELWFNWIVRMTADGQPVGVMQATVAADSASADVAWEVGVPWQGRGVASEAASAVVEWLVDHDIVLIRALIHPDHTASARVAARAGLEPTPELVDGEVVWRRIAR